MMKRIRSDWPLRAVALLLTLSAGNLLAVRQVRSEDPKDDQPTAPLAKGQRVFTCGHSFHVWVCPMLSEMAKAAGIKQHQSVGLSSIGGSRVIQHWDVAEEKNKAKAALRAGNVDVLTLSPIWLPDAGIEKFARLGLEHNPGIRVTVQEFWLPNDTYRPVYPLEAQEGGPQRHDRRGTAETASALFS